MPNPAASIYKLLAYKVESTYGTLPGAAGGQLLRRVTSTLDLNKQTYKSNEVRPDFQTADFRHGARSIGGAISGELSAKTYADFFAAALKRAFTAGVSATAQSLTIAGSAPTWTVTRGAGSFLTDGFKVGRVVRLSVGALNAANINRNLLITGVTALVLTVIAVNYSASAANPLVNEGPITGSTVTEIGKATYIPQSGHTDLSFTFEHWFSDLGQSEQFTGCKIDKIAIGLPPTGMATISLDVMGQNLTPAASQYFTSPTAITSTGIDAAVNGVLRMNGATVAVLTGLTIEIDPMFTGDAVVGSNLIPFLFAGPVNVTGQATAYFADTTLRDAFLNETEIDLAAVLTADNSNAADFLAFSIPRLKVGGATKDDSGGIKLTLPFQALMNVNGGTGIATEKTTINVQDSQA